MKKLRKVVTLGAITLALGATSLTAFAASQYKTPAEVVAGITGRTEESVIEERLNLGKTYGTIASEAGKLDEFKSEMLDMKKANLTEQVAEGKMTQENADAIIEKIKNLQEDCDGTGNAKIGSSMGARLGSNGEGLGNGRAYRGNGVGRGQGGGRGMGIGGMRLQDGSCYLGDN